MSHLGSRGREEQRLGYWSAQEQYSMSDLLDFAVEAERGGFRSMMASDHFHPWFHTGAFGNFTWVWMAAAAERTKQMSFFTGVTCPIFRYTPGVVAQAFASLDDLYPGRIGLGVGTGEAMNEVSNGFDWGTQAERLERTKEAIEIIKALWEGGSGFLDYRGRYYRTDGARLYTPPKGRIPLYMAAVGKNSTRTAAKYSDGLITFLKGAELERQISAFKGAVAQEGRDPASLEIVAEYKLSCDPDYDRAFESVKRWRPTRLQGVLMSEIHDPRELEKKAEEEVSDESLKASWHVVTSIDESAREIDRYFKAGFTKVYVHSSSPDERAFIREFTAKVLPHYSSAR
ncbi:MAG: TIGR03557 family F420-dependent LLM class oxidoreductase [Nitrososphaerales archaeon]